MKNIVVRNKSDWLLLPSFKINHFFFIACLFGQFVAEPSDEIRYGADVMHLSTGADIASMGDAGVALPNRSASTIWNPASAGFIDRYQFSAEGADLYSHLSQQGCFAISAPLKDNGGVALSYLPFYSGLIEQYDTISDIPENPLMEYTPKGYFKNYHHILNLALAHKISLTLPGKNVIEKPLPFDIAIGGNLKAYMQIMNPDNNSYMGLGYNLDLGIITCIGLDYDLSKKKVCRALYMSATIRDIVPSEIMWIYSNDDTWMYSPEDYREPFDYSQYYGISYSDISGDLPLNWTIALSLHKEYDVTYHGGVEIDYMKTVFFRAGLSDQTPAIGAGFHYRNFFIDYALRFDDIAVSFVRLTAGVFLIAHQ